jgi:hypothetical protein
MATRRNPYHDPSIREGLNNLAGLFAPPSGQEMAGFAAANAKRQEAERLAAIFSNPDPAAAAELAARMGIANYGQTRSGFGKTDATNRRGQDIKASTDLEQERIKGANDIAKLYASPVILSQNQSAIMPQQTQQGTGLPQVLMGIQERDPGKAYALPDGTTAMGPPKPRTSDEVVAAIMEEQIRTGGVTPQAVLGPKLGTPLQTQGPQGAQFEAPGDAMARRAAPAAAPRKVKDVVTDATGRQINIMDDGSSQFSDGTPVPTDTRIVNRATPQGSNEQLGLGTTANRSRAQAIRGTVANADRLMADIDQTIRTNPASAGLAANVISFTQDVGQVFREFGEKFSNPNTPVSMQDLAAMTARIAPGEYNPVYRRVKAQLLELAYTNARLNNPSGEVSRFALEREIEALGLGTVGNDKAVLAVLDASRGRLRRSLAEADVLEGTARAPTPDSLYSPENQPAAPRPQAGAAAPGRARIISAEPVQ